MNIENRCEAAGSWSYRLIIGKLNIIFRVDLRHNGTFFEIEDKEIDKYVSAWKNNFKTYTALQTKFSYNESFETTGEKNMPIRIGKFSGVYLMPFNLPVKNENELNRLLSDYAYAKKRATQVQCMMKTL